jgi:hypothetical protein
MPRCFTFFLLSLTLLLLVGCCDCCPAADPKPRFRGVMDDIPPPLTALPPTLPPQ